MKTLAFCSAVVFFLTPLSPGGHIRADETQPSGNNKAAAGPASFATVVENLSPESRKKFGEMLASDWKNRPQWGDMLIGLLKGEEMRPGFGWFQPSDKKFDFSWLSAKFDANADGLVAKEELPPEAPDVERCFARLDRDNDGKLKFSDFDYAGRQHASQPLMMSQFLFRLLDVDSNGRATAEELNDFLTRADKDKTGFLTAEDMFLDFSNAIANRNGGGDMPGPDEILSMFFRGELGLWQSGPKLGGEAPDFTLPTHDGAQTVTLSTRRGKPVILIFGSFT